MPTIPTIPGMGGISVINGVKGYKEFAKYCQGLKASGWVPNPLPKPNTKLVTHKSVTIGDFTAHLYIYTYDKYTYSLQTLNAAYSQESEYYDEGIKEKLGGERSTLGG